MLRDPELEVKHADYYKEHAKGIYASTHSAFNFIPLQAIMPERDITQLVKNVDLDSSILFKEAGVMKSLEMQKKWMGDENQAQVELIQLPVCSSTRYII